MAVNSLFFINSGSFSTATAVYLDSTLTMIAPDGYYGDGTVSRQQSGGILLTAVACETCGTACGARIDTAIKYGIYLITTEAGFTSSDVGAIIIQFAPTARPSGIRATYNSVIYNKLSAPLDGVHQSTTSGDFTYVGKSGDDCGISGSTYTLGEYVWNGTDFDLTTNSQSITVAAGDVSLTSSLPGLTVMVIPKTSVSPSNVYIEVSSPCENPAWALTVGCPLLLTGFSSSTGHITSEGACSDTIDQVYYNVPVTGDWTNLGLYDYVFSDPYGEFPLPTGYYKFVGSTYDWYEIENGVIVSFGTCP